MICCIPLISLKEHATPPVDEDVHVAQLDDDEDLLSTTPSEPSTSIDFEQESSQQSSTDDPTTSSAQVRKEQKCVTTGTGRCVGKSKKTIAIEEENILMKKAVRCLDSFQTMSQCRNAASMNDKQKDGLGLFGEYIVSEMRNIPSQHALDWAKIQIQSIILSARTRSASQSPAQDTAGASMPNYYFAHQ